ncbi:MAG: HlyC/CorC family transporter [Deltaproteobacteria bacterium]|nr:HlyC/CorC family transporter [Deltaproteobacteria bacterium]
MPDLDVQISGGEVLILVVGLVLSVVYSAAETALSALSEAKTRAIIDAGGRRARLLQFWIDKPQHAITTTLTGKKAANTTVAVLAALVADRMFSSIWVDVGVAVAVIALLLLGELTPRAFAKVNAAAVAPTLMPFVLATYVVSFPLVWAFTRFSAFLRRASGGGTAHEGPNVTEDELLSSIQLASKEGVLDKASGRMLKSIFDLGDTLVREVMVPRTEISSVPIGATLDEVLAEVHEKGHSRLPVFDDNLDEVKGFFHTKDLLNVLAEKKPFSLKDHLRPMLFVPELMRTSDLLKLFQKKKTHLAVVVDEYGGTAGIVAFEDVLEEIVGPIHDEHDEDETPVKRLEDGRLLAEGRASLYEIGEALGLQFPTDSGYETLGGFLIARTGRMPQRGDRVAFAGHTFVVRDADEKRVARVEIEAQRGTQPPILANERRETSGPTAAAPGEVSGPVRPPEPPPPSSETAPATTPPTEVEGEAKGGDDRPRPRLVKG